MLMMANVGAKKGKPDILKEMRDLDAKQVTDTVTDYYGDDDGVSLEQFSSFLEELHAELQIEKQAKNPELQRQSTSTGHGLGLVQMAKEMQSKRKEAVAVEVAKFPREFPVYAELEDPEILNRIHPDIGEEEPEVGDLAPEDQYTWDYCCVFKVGDPDNMIKVTETPEATEEDDKPKSVVTSKSQGDHFHEVTATAIASMKLAGLKTFCFMSVQKDEIYCLVGIDEVRCAQEADRLGMDIPLSPEGVKTIGLNYNLDLAKNAEHVGEDVFKDLYGSFVDFGDDERAGLYRTTRDGPYHPKSVFRQVDRLKLVYSCVGADVVQGGADLKPRKDMKTKTHPLVAFFPLHHKPAKEKLHKEMLSSWMNVFHPPETAIKDYFGEELGMYFCFLSCYTRWLVIPAVIGTCFMVYMFATPNPLTGASFNIDPPAGFGFGLFVCIWSTAFLEAWGRKQSRLASDWGMTNLESQEVTRPEFVGEFRVDPITGVLDVYFPFYKYLKRLLVARAVVLSLISLVVSLIIGMFILRVLMQNSNAADPAVSSILLAVVNFVQIQLMNFIYSTVSAKLNDWENHRTDTAFENARILKSFIFKFFNTYSTFTYIILIKRHVGDTTTAPGEQPSLFCSGSYNAQVKALTSDVEKNYLSNKITVANFTKEYPNWSFSKAALEAINLGMDYRGDCVQELAIQLGVVFGLALVVNNAMEIGVPFVKNLCTARREAVAGEDGKKGFKKMDRAASGKSDAEEQYEFEQYEGTFGDYDELVVQFGYAVLFVTACPLVPLAALINNIVEYRLDATKVLTMTRRPIPRGVKDMGYWQSVLGMFSWIAIVFIVAIATFASRGFAQAFLPIENGLPQLSYQSWFAFIVLEHFLFFVKIIVAWLIPDEPGDVTNHQRRSKIIVEGIINRKN